MHSIYTTNLTLYNSITDHIFNNVFTFHSGGGVGFHDYDIFSGFRGDRKLWTTLNYARAVDLRLESAILRLETRLKN